jgi:hypothetical protein
MANFFCLRRVSEHHNLHFSRLARLYQPNRCRYIENGSKTNDGGVEDYRLAVKIVTIVMVPDSVRCHVKLLDFYLAHVLPEMVQKGSRFYLRPLEYPTPNIWYYRQPIGVNKIQAIVKNVCTSRHTRQFHQPQSSNNWCIQPV